VRNLLPHLLLPFAAGFGAVLVLLIAQASHSSQLWAQAAGASSRQAANKPQPAPHGSTALPAPRPGWNYPLRLTLTYEVDWRVFPAGTATVHIESNGDSQRILVTGDSLGAFNLIYRVSDHFQSTFSRQTGCSAGFAKQTMQGTSQISLEQQFSGGQSHTTDDEKTLITRTHHAEQVAIPPCVSDPLSAIFYAASQPLQSGQQFHLPVVYGPDLIDATVKVEGQEAVRAPTTTYQALRVQPTWSNPAVRNSGNIWVWYTDDDRHIPVQLRARLFWGTITFRLTGIEQK